MAPSETGRFAMRNLAETAAAYDLRCPDLPEAGLAYFQGVGFCGETSPKDPRLFIAGLFRPPYRPGQLISSANCPPLSGACSTLKAMASLVIASMPETFSGDRAGLGINSSRIRRAR